MSFIGTIPTRRYKSSILQPESQQTSTILEINFELASWQVGAFIR